MPRFGLKLFFPFLALFLLLGIFGCSTKKVPPADLITPDQDSAELFDPMNPSAFAVDGESNAYQSQNISSKDGLTPDVEEISVTGSGASLSEPAVIKGVYSRLGKMDAENDFISEKLGKEGRDWKTKSVSSQNVGTRKCEIITVENIKEQSERSFYFDITEYSDSWE